MSVPSPSPISEGNLWNAVQSAVSQRASTAQVWEAIRAQAQQTGSSLPAGGIQIVNQFRSIAAQLRNATEALSAAGPGAVIDDAMIGTSPFARQGVEFGLAPRTQVRFEQTVVTESGMETIWRSDVITGALPSTKGQLLAMLASTADLLASHYGATNGGIGAVQLVAL